MSECDHRSAIPASVGSSHGNETVITLDTVLQRVTDLRPLPTIGNEVLKLLQEDDPSVGVRRLLSAEPALAAKVLRVANSPFYGMRMRISTIDHAVLVLGTRATIAVIIAVATFNTVRADQSTPESFQARMRFLQHAVGCALAARLLAQGRTCNPEEAFLAGLLHDVGRLVFLEFCPDVLMKLHGGGQLDDDDPVAEHEILGFDHQEVGGALLEHWQFPPAIVEALRQHHQPLQADGAIKNGQLPSVLYVADAFATAADTCMASGDVMRQFVQSDVSTALALSESEITAVETELPRLVADTLAIWEGAGL